MQVVRDGCVCVCVCVLGRGCASDSLREKVSVMAELILEALLEYLLYELHALDAMFLFIGYGMACTGCSLMRKN